MRLALTLLTALVMLGLAPPAHALDEGVPDRHRHPNVGLIGVDDDGEGPEGPRYLCSGVVISDRHFLTAGHCAAIFRPGTPIVVSFEPGSPAAPVYRPGVSPTSSRSL